MEIPPSPRRSSTDIWFDPNTGRLGFGYTYGEMSFNNRPLNAVYGLPAIREYVRRNRPPSKTSQQTQS